MTGANATDMDECHRHAERAPTTAMTGGPLLRRSRLAAAAALLCAAPRGAAAWFNVEEASMELVNNSFVQPAPLALATFGYPPYGRELRRARLPPRALSGYGTGPSRQGTPLSLCAFSARMRADARPGVRSASLVYLDGDAAELECVAPPQAR